MTTRTTAEVEAGARALSLAIFPNLVFDSMPESTRDSLRRWTSASLTAADAVARAVCPPGYSVVADDDLRVVLDIAEERLLPQDEHDRLRAALGDKG